LTPAILAAITEVADAATAAGTTESSAASQDGSSSQLGAPAAERLAPPAWYDQTKHITERREMVTWIAELLQARNPDASTEWMAKLPQLARRLEESLFRCALSFGKYRDQGTIRSRLRKLALDKGIRATGAGSGAAADGAGASGGGGALVHPSAVVLAANEAVAKANEMAMGVPAIAATVPVATADAIEEDRPSKAAAADAPAVETKFKLKSPLSPKLKSPLSPGIDCIWSKADDQQVLMLTPSPGFLNQCSDAETVNCTAAIGGKAALVAADIAAEAFVAEKAKAAEDKAEDEKANAAIARAAEAASAEATKAAALAAGIAAKAKKQEQVKAVKAEVAEAEAAKFMSAQDLIANDAWFATLHDNEIEAVYADTDTYSKGANGIGDTPSAFQASIRNLYVSFFLNSTSNKIFSNEKKKSALRRGDDDAPF
jgi:hypothetical protein